MRVKLCLQFRELNLDLKPTNVFDSRKRKGSSEMNSDSNTASKRPKPEVEVCAELSNCDAKSSTRPIVSSLHGVWNPNPEKFLKKSAKDKSKPGLDTKKVKCSSKTRLLKWLDNARTSTPVRAGPVCDKTFTVKSDTVKSDVHVEETNSCETSGSMSNLLPKPAKISTKGASVTNSLSQLNVCEISGSSAEGASQGNSLSQVNVCEIAKKDASECSSQLQSTVGFDSTSSSMLNAVVEAYSLNMSPVLPPGNVNSVNFGSFGSTCSSDDALLYSALNSEDSNGFPVFLLKTEDQDLVEAANSQQEVEFMANSHAQTVPALACLSENVSCPSPDLSFPTHLLKTADHDLVEAAMLPSNVGSAVVSGSMAEKAEGAAVQTPVVMGWGRDWLPEGPRPGGKLGSVTNARGKVVNTISKNVDSKDMSAFIWNQWVAAKTRVSFKRSAETCSSNLRLDNVVQKLKFCSINEENQLFAASPKNTCETTEFGPALPVGTDRFTVLPLENAVGTSIKTQGTKFICKSNLVDPKNPDEPSDVFPMGCDASTGPLMDEMGHYVGESGRDQLNLNNTELDPSDPVVCGSQELPLDSFASDDVCVTNKKQGFH